jgi:hypothetical protein
MKQPNSNLDKLAPRAVRLAALWVLTVTSIKLFKGSPNDLPPIIRDHFFGPKLNFNLSIGVELTGALLGLLHPRVGFALLTALMLLFVSVLLYLISQGATSCGCFGGAISFPPWAMLLVDGSLLACMLATRPWRSIRATRVPVVLGGIAALASFAAPWLLIRTSEVKAPLREQTQDGSLPAVWRLPEPLPEYALLEPSTWIGKSIHETQLAVWMDTSAYPTDGSWVLYQVQCPHCRDYLRRMESEFASAPRSYVLINLADHGDDDPEKREVDLMPPGDLVELPLLARGWAGLTPPWELVLEGGVVKDAQFRGDG